MRSFPLPSVLTVLIALTACGSARASDFRKESLPTAAFDVPQAVFANQLAHFPEGAEGRQEMTLT
ncbi:MAG TPA: hypothetical protein VJ597_02070, partial [Sphingomicrobium sp.]|nr:hypothetical protein [Sphingomicrobium sp.]